jgi:predicted GTPase
VKLREGARILMAEACTHHAQPDDLGRVKIPRWLRNYLGIEINFDFAAGREFPENIGEYDLIVQCGGCMLTRREMLYRLYRAKEAGVPMVNYGIIIAFLHGILKRSVEIFGLESEVEGL